MRKKTHIKFSRDIGISRASKIEANDEKKFKPTARM